MNFHGNYTAARTVFQTLVEAADLLSGDPRWAAISAVILRSVERGKGILQSKYKLTEEEAYLRLRSESRRLRRPMRDLAEAIILADDLNRRETTAARPPARADAELT